MDNIACSLKYMIIMMMKVISILLVLCNNGALGQHFNMMIDTLEIKDNMTDKGVLQETTLMWTEKGWDNRVALKGVQGNPETWAKEGVKHTFISQPLFGYSLYASHRLALTFRYADREVFFSDKTFKEIYMLKFQQSTSRPFKYNKTLEVIFSGTSTMVYGLAVDWLAGTLYWTDALYNWISMTTLDDPSYYKHVVVTGLDIPFGVAVYPQKGYLFWTDYGARSKIERSMLDGSKREVIVKTDLAKPLGITVDYQEDKIYWVDDKKDTIEIADLDGSSRTIVKLKEVTTRSVFLLFGIAVYKDYVFIADRVHLDIQVYDKQNFSTVYRLQTGTSRPYDVMVYDKTRQPTPGPDQPNEGCPAAGCEQICVNMGQGQVKCECGVGYELKKDGKTCKGKQRGMPQYIYTLGERLCATNVYLPDKTDHPLASDSYCFLKNLAHVEALAMHSYAELLFYSDTRNREIVRVRMDLDEAEYAEKEVIAVQTGNVRGIAVDYMTNNLYWSDREYNHIMISKIDGRYPTILVENAGYPRAIEVDMLTRVMYWSSETAINTADLDGSNAKLYNTYKVMDPDGMSMDPVKNRLYWCNGNPKPNITHVDINNITKQLTISATEGLSAEWTFRDVTVYQDYVAWTDGKGGVHFARNKLTPGNTYRRTISHADVNVSHDIITYDTYLQPIANYSACDDENGGCDHICIPKLGNTRVCKCAIGFTLDVDGHTCKSELLQDNFILFADPYHRQIYQMNPDKKLSLPQGIKIANLNNPKIVEYDQTKKLIYWVEFLPSGHFIKRADMHGESEVVLPKFEKDSPIGDLIVFNNRLYYTADGHVIVIDLNTGNIVPFYERGDVFPNSLGIDRKSGTLFWASKGSVKLFKAELCNPKSQPRLLKRLNINVNITGLSILGQSPEKLIIWNRVKMWEVNLSTGTYKVILTNNSYNIQSAGYWGGSIYISMWNQKKIYKLANGKLEEFSKPLFSRILGLKTYGSNNDVRSNCRATTTSSTTTTTTSTSAKVKQTTYHEKATTQYEQVDTTIPIGSNLVNNQDRNVQEKNTMTSTRIFVLAGSSVAAFFVIVIVLSIVCFTMRRKQKRKPSTTVHYQSDSHDNPTYMTHNDVTGIPRATAQDMTGAAGATGVSFDPLPVKEPAGAGEIAAVVTEDNIGHDPSDVSDKAKLVEEEENRNANLQEIVFTVNGNSDTVAYNAASSLP